MGVEHVVILMLENRSFDEYFGTFPGANGFYSNLESAFANAWVPMPGNWTDRPILPYRLSTFSSQQGHAWGCNHSAPAQHSYYAGGAMNGWSLKSALNPVSCMGYYAADDIPYHWWLAQNFALCDNYYCSVLGPTEPNRIYLMTGTINQQAEFLNKPGWQTYPDMLTAAGVSWRLYDDQSSQTTLPDAGDFGGLTLSWELNALSYFSSWATLGDPAGPYYRPGLNYFLADARSRGGLPTVSWIIPQYAYTEHPPFTAADGALLLSTITEALLASPDWETTVLIVTYDENDGHFDHVAPPQPSPAQYPEEFIDGQSIGAGFRVPTLVISPWTVGRGICSDPYDHTSTLMFLEDITGVPCRPNISAWRREAFASLSTIGFDGAATTAASVPRRPHATILEQNAVARYHANPGRSGASVWAPNLSPADLVPAQQAWRPEPQGCQIIMTSQLYGQGEVNGQPGASFPGALTVVASGFEPAELTTPYAGYRAKLTPRGVVYIAGSGLQTIAAQSPANPACLTRVPGVTITDSGGNPVAIEAACQYVDLDPGSLANQPSGVPQTFRFTYSLTFTDPEATFGGGDQMLSVIATFQVDIEVTAQAHLEVTVSPAQRCAALAAGITQRFEHGGPPVTPAEEATLQAQLTACRDQGQLTLQQYERALYQLRELNVKGQPPGPPGGGVNPPP